MRTLALTIVTILLWSVPLAAQEGAAEPTEILVYPFVFSGLTKAEADTYTKAVGQVMADVVQSKLYEIDGMKPVTVNNLKSQMQKVEVTEALQCADNSCLKKIMDNFGIEDNLHGTVTKVGDEFQVTLTWTKDDEVVKAQTGEVTIDVKALKEKVKDLTGILFEAPVTSGSQVIVKTAGGGAWDPQASVPVSIQTKPKGASLMLDGKEVGVTPYTGFMKPGTYEAKLFRPYYLTMSTKIKVTAGKGDSMQTFAFDLEPNFGTVKLDGVPAEVAVYLDGTFQGKGMNGIAQVNPGTHWLTFEAEAYLSKKLEVTVKKGETVRLDAELEMKKGFVQVMAIDKEGEALSGKVLLDGKAIGSLPFAGKVPVGSHTIKVVTSEGDQSQAIQIAHKENKELTLTVGRGIESGSEERPGAGVTAKTSTKWTKTKETVFWTGLTALGVGAALQLAGWSKAQELEESGSSSTVVTSMTQAEMAEEEDTIEIAYYAAYALYGVGAIVTAVAFFLPNEPIKGTHGLAPMVFPGAAGISYSTSW